MLAGSRRAHQKGAHVAASKRPSFLKRQKEQARLARATEKREARRARKHSKSNAAEMQDAEMPDTEMAETLDDQVAEGEDTEERPL
jgi:hypothetical protein